MSNILHPERFDLLPVTGTVIRDTLAECVDEVERVTEEIDDPNVSVLIRSRNNAAQLEELLDDVATQDFHGETEVVVVDTESTDGSVQLAKQCGATIVRITQEDFNYPRALNLGFEAASHPWVFSYVSHSALTNDQTLKVATRWHNNENVAAAYGTVLPNTDASKTERLVGATGLLPYMKASSVPGKPGVGFMGTNAALVRHEAWQDVGGFDESYGAGGEDGILGAALLDKGLTVMREPALSAFHSHGVGPLDYARQLKYWMSLGQAQQFSAARLARFRTDG